MTNVELALNMLAEASTKEISQSAKPKTFVQNKSVARQGGDVAKAARVQLEKSTGKSAISPLNAKSLLPTIEEKGGNDE